MSRELALELAVRHHSGNGSTAADVVNTADAFAAFLGSSTAASKPRAVKPKADPAPTETLASSPAAEADASLNQTPPAAQSQKAAPAATAAPAMTAEAFKAVLSSAASNPNVGPVQVRAVLAKFTNPDTKKPAQNFTTLHVSHYAPAAKELQELIEAAQQLAA